MTAHILDYFVRHPETYEDADTCLNCCGALVDGNVEEEAPAGFCSMDCWEGWHGDESAEEVPT